ncbi:helix-turn-helix domain-containing protein [Streptomyces sp. NBC_00448]|uniref:helix-turn-helix domain-containing protein n=1 Tax=Streptomyces sp. NBC_00448 TaxID=2903652 RepID=UPI002E1B52EC
MTKPSTPAPLFANSEATARALYAHQLAVLRAKAGLTLTELSDQCHYEQSYLHRLETGGRLGTLDVALALDRFYHTGDLLVRLWHLAKREAKQVAAGGIASLEATATTIQEYALTAIPDLLLAPAYAKEQLAATGPHHLRALNARLEELRLRQARLTATASPPVHYRAILDEIVLQHAVHHPTTWADQLDHLITAAQHPAVALHILPLGGGPRVLHGPLQLLSFRVGRPLAHAHSTLTGHLTDDPDDVEQLRQSYDNLRDTALTPTQTLTHLHALRTTNATASTSTAPPP